MAQFYFAADRETPSVSRRYDPLNPGFLDFIKSILYKAKKFDVPVGYCGEQISDPLVAIALIGLGLTHLSVAATSVGPMRRLVRMLNAEQLNEWFDEQAMSAKDTLRLDLRSYLERQGVTGF